MLEVQDWVMGKHPHENHSEALIFKFTMVPLRNTVCTAAAKSNSAKSFAAKKAKLK
jgi:hypothetical protein